MFGPKKFSSTFKVEKPDFARKNWTQKLDKGFERKEDVNGKYTVYSNKYLKTSIQKIISLHISLCTQKDKTKQV